MKAKAILVLAAAALAACTPAGKVTSPDGGLALEFDASTLSWSALWRGTPVLTGCLAAQEIPDNAQAPAGRIKTKLRKGVTEHVSAPLYRQSGFSWTYNEMTVDLGDGRGMQWRVSDDGIAYRFTTSREGRTTLSDETALVHFASDGTLTRCVNTNYDHPFRTSFENDYVSSPLSEGTANFDFLPASVLTPEGVRVTIAESDVHSYPVAFFKGEAGTTTLSLEFPPYPGQEWIASSEGARTYPWRIFKFTTEDAAIAEDNLVYALATPSKVEDVTWIKPGFCAWEWWNDWGLEGVDFKPGVNEQTYRAYIDFASDYGLDYCILDEGWGKHGPGQNLLVPIPGFDLEGLAKYASDKGVRLILWAVMDRLYKEAGAVFERYAKMGVAAFKPDFLDRGDQQAVEMLESVLQSAAAHGIMIDCHGIFPPCGLNRTWPNLINVEGVKGLENAKWCGAHMDFPAHDCALAYLRAMAGPCDYTPGAMRNTARDKFVCDYRKPCSMGTRAHQVALYGVLDSPLTMLCDSPSNYRAEDATTRFIASLPRIYSSKKVLCGKMGEYIVVARESGGVRYLSGITDWNARDLELDLGFLPEGEWSWEMFADGEDAAENAESFTIRCGSVAGGGTLSAHMAPGGGFCAVLKKI